jgi:hypothetical protein
MLRIDPLAAWQIANGHDLQARMLAPGRRIKAS